MSWLLVFKVVVVLSEAFVVSRLLPRMQGLRREASCTGCGWWGPTYHMGQAGWGGPKCPRCYCPIEEREVLTCGALVGMALLLLFALMFAGAVISYSPH